MHVVNIETSIIFSICLADILDDTLEVLEPEFLLLFFIHVIPEMKLNIFISSQVVFLAKHCE